MPTLRDMRPADVEPLASWMVTLPLLQRYGLTLDGANRQFQAGLGRGDTLLTVEEDGRLVGFAWMLPNGAFGRSPYLRLIGVHPECTSRGVGALLLDAIEARAWTLADVLFLLVSDFNTRAQHFYERQGYHRIGALADYVVPGVAELLYWKHRVAE